MTACALVEFGNVLLFTVGSSYPPTQPPSWRTSRCELLATAYSNIRGYLHWLSFLLVMILQGTSQHLIPFTHLGR
jgi:hypothetical protein